MKQIGFGGRALALAVAATIGASVGCNTDKVNPPALDGPSALGLDVRLTASPDIILADGFSSSVIQATIYDQNGRVIGGRDIVFTVADANGRQADIGELHSRSNQTLGTSVVERTDGNGLAQVVYYAPARTDATANQTVVIQARPVGTDAEAALYRTVRVELRSAEPRLFAPNPGNAAPNCNFAVQAPDGFRAGRAILFQTTSSDSDGTVVRFEWFWGDGTYSDHPDNAHVFPTPATYTVTHVVTDNEGAQKACSADITVF